MIVGAPGRDATGRTGRLPAGRQRHPDASAWCVAHGGARVRGDPLRRPGRQLPRRPALPRLSALQRERAAAGRAAWPRCTGPTGSSPSLFFGLVLALVSRARAAGPIRPAGGSGGWRRWSLRRDRGPDRRGRRHGAPPAAAGAPGAAPAGGQRWSGPRSVVLVFRSGSNPGRQPAERGRRRAAERPSLLRRPGHAHQAADHLAAAGDHRRPDVHHAGGAAPAVRQVLWVLLGGYLMAGGANAINMWFDRDIDTR